MGELINLFWKKEARKYTEFNPKDFQSGNEEADKHNLLFHLSVLESILLEYDPEDPPINSKEEIVTEIVEAMQYYKERFNEVPEYEGFTTSITVKTKEDMEKVFPKIEESFLDIVEEGNTAQVSLSAITTYLGGRIQEGKTFTNSKGKVFKVLKVDSKIQKATVKRIAQRSQ